MTGKPIANACIPREGVEGVQIMSFETSKDGDGLSNIESSASTATSADVEDQNVPTSDYAWDVEDDSELPPGNVDCSFVTGDAGTGKTYEIRRRIRENPKYGILAATTGIAAVNLDAVTINGLLKFFDTDSLREQYLVGRLTKYLKFLGVPGIVIDEVSMMDAEQLDIIYKAASELGREFRLVLTGDFAQLPPVKAKWAFQAECWPEFEKNTTRLTKMWRQSDPRFLEAINLIRSGRGNEGTEVLKAMGIKFFTAGDIEFDGTTILAKNIDVDRHNEMALMKVPGKALAVPSKRWGKLKSEWKHLPEVLKLKIGAYVMILTNNWDMGQNSYVNGDCGHIVEYIAERGVFAIKLVRDGRVVEVQPIVRNAEQKERPDWVLGEEGHDAKDFWPNQAGKAWHGFYYSPSGKVTRKRWITGQIKYFPIRLAYASTVHKTQGLSLDKVQMDVRNHFFGSPSMIYVALSRCKTPEGLRIVGQSDVFAKRVMTAPEILKWL
jgi:ATP-dependent DNA helicase PIF1